MDREDYEGAVRRHKDRVHSHAAWVLRGLDDDELVVVRLKGKLHKFLPGALEQTGWTEMGAAFDDLG